MGLRAIGVALILALFGGGSNQALVAPCVAGIIFCTGVGYYVGAPERCTPRQWQTLGATCTGLTTALALVSITAATAAEDRLFRHRLMAHFGTQLKLIVRVFGFEFGGNLLFLAASSASMYLAFLQCRYLHGDTISLKVVLLELFHSAVCASMLGSMGEYQQEAYALHRELSKRSSAVDCLVSMFCDCVVELDADSLSVLRCNRPMYGLGDVEQRLKGGFLEYLPEGVEVDRFQNAIAQSALGPVLLQTTLLLERQLEVQLYIVAQGHVGTTHREGQAEEKTVLCGIRIVPEQEACDSSRKKGSSVDISEDGLLPLQSVKLFPTTVLGCGGFGTVVLGVHQGKEVAVKLAVHGGTRREARVKLLNSLANELRLLRYVRHSNIVLLYGACVDGAGEIGLVFERVVGVELKEFARGPLSAQNKQKVLADVCAAVRHLHCQRPAIVHGDLKCSNILVEERGRLPHATLIDFGLSRLLARGARPVGGTLMWMAPETVLRSCAPMPSADVFSLGRLAYFVVTSRYPPHEDQSSLIRKAKQAAVEPLIWPEEEVELAGACRVLTEQCCQFHASARPTAVDVHDTVLRWNGVPPQPVDWEVGVRVLQDATELRSWLPRGKVAMVFDVLDPESTVLFASEGWLELCGSKGARDLFTRKGWKQFMVWLRPHMFTSFGETLRYPGKTVRGRAQDGSTYSALVDVVLPKEDSHEDWSTYELGFSFANIRRNTLKRTVRALGLQTVMEES